jgi:hypothetical protein
MGVFLCDYTGCYNGLMTDATTSHVLLISWERVCVCECVCVCGCVCVCVCVRARIRHGTVSDNQRNSVTGRKAYLWLGKL